MLITHCYHSTPNRQENIVEMNSLEEHIETESDTHVRIDSLLPEGRDGLQPPIQVTMGNINTLVLLLSFLAVELDIGVTSLAATSSE